MVWYFGNVLLYFSHNHKVTTRGASASKKWQLSWIDHLSWIKFYWLLWYLCWAEWKSQKLMGSSAPYHDFMLFYNQLCWEHFPCKRPLQDINNEKSPDTPQCRYHDAGNGGENYSLNEYKPVESNHIWMDGYREVALNQECEKFSHARIICKIIHLSQEVIMIIFITMLCCLWV